MKPTVGRIVHMYTGNVGPLAGVVTEVVSDDEVHLVVFGLSENQPIVNAFSVFKKNNSIAERYWDWPPRPVTETVTKATAPKK